MAEHIQIDFGKAMPVFPLPEAVLLPHAVLPLHVFEPRYRQMVNDALDSHGLIAMALFQREVGEHEYLWGKPALRPFAGLGYIDQYQKLDDGRFVIGLRGLCRIRLLEEQEHKPYRQFFMKPIEPDMMPDDQLEAERGQVERLVNDPAFASYEPIQQQKEWIRSEVPSSALIDLLIHHLFEDSNKRYAMLAEPNAQVRGRWLAEQLHALRLIHTAEN